MKPVMFLRVASVVTLIHAVLHTIGGVFGRVGAGPAAAAADAMKKNQFLVMGHIRSFWDFYFGLGLAATISLTAEGIVLWQLASLAKTDAQKLRPIIATFMVAYLVQSVNSNAHFFIGPVITEVLMAACLAGAMVTAGSPVLSGDRVSA